MTERYEQSHFVTQGHTAHHRSFGFHEATKALCCQGPEENTWDFEGPIDQLFWRTELGVRTPVKPGTHRRGRPESFQGSVVAAAPRLDEAELVTMVRCSRPSFTGEGLLA